MLQISRSLFLAALCLCGQPTFAEAVRLNCAPLGTIWKHLDFDLSYAYRFHSFREDDTETGQSAREKYEMLNLDNGGYTTLRLVEGASCRWTWTYPRKGAEVRRTKLSYQCVMLTVPTAEETPEVWAREADELLNALGKCFSELSDVDKEVASVDVLEERAGSLWGLSRKAIKSPIGDESAPVAMSSVVVWQEGYDEIGHIQIAVGKTVGLPGDPRQTSVILSQLVTP